MKTYKRLLKYILPYQNNAWGALACMLIGSLCNVVVIPLVGKLSEAIGKGDLAYLNMVILAAAGVYFLRGLAMYGQLYMMYFVGQRVITDLRIKVFSHLQDLSLDFYSKWRSGDVISRIVGDIAIIQGAIVSTVVDVAPTIITLVGVLGYLLYLNWTLTLLTLIIIPLLSWVIRRFGEEMHDVSVQTQRKAADITSHLQEALTGVRVIKSFAQEKHEIKKFSEETEKGFWLMMRQAQLSATQTPLLSFIQALAIIGVIWYGGFQVVTGRLSAANLISFFTGLALIADPVGKIGQLNWVFQNSLASAKRVFEVIDIVPSVQEIQNAKPIGPIRGKIEFRNVSFKYENDGNLILDKINLVAEPGKIIALVGSSGAGKTTLVNLIPRFYDPTEGSILIDDLDVKNLQISSYRSQMGIVQQESTLFNGTIRDNIAYGKTTATEAEVQNAAKIANAHDFILSLPDGYNTWVGEKGVMLSGGQRQRITIARAVLRDPKILIFDEATSSLDSESEKLVQEAIDRLLKGRTTFIIAHRLSTVQHADQILVMQNGAIVESGRHQDLLSVNGIYKKLYETQFSDPTHKNE
jgi:subfamily B ATP-binding cassette protein MsbA